VDKLLIGLEQQLQEKKVEVSFAEELRACLEKKGFDPQMGARPMQRLIQDTIRKALADELLFGRLVNGGRVHIAIDPSDAEKVVLEFPSEDAPSKPAASGRAKDKAELVS